MPVAHLHFDIGSGTKAHVVPRLIAEFPFELPVFIFAYIPLVSSIPFSSSCCSVIRPDNSSLKRSVLRTASPTNMPRLRYPLSTFIATCIASVLARCMRYLSPWMTSRTLLLANPFPSKLDHLDQPQCLSISHTESLRRAATRSRTLRLPSANPCLPSPPTSLRRWRSRPPPASSP